MILSSTHYEKQDNLTQEKIALVSAKAGLYIFNSAIFCTVATHNFVSFVNYTIKNFNFWHYKLGHFFDERLQVLRTQYPYITVGKLHLSEICNQVTQKKPFFL